MEFEDIQKRQKATAIEIFRNLPVAAITVYNRTNLSVVGVNNEVTFA